MDDVNLNDLRVFIRVVEAGSFSAAARSLRMAKSSVSRSVARLEDDLGVRLLERSARATAPTEAGRRYFERVSDAMRAVATASAEAASRHAPRGTVRLSAPPAVGSEVLPSLLASFCERYPEIEVEVEMETGSVSADLIENGYDLAIRGGLQPDSSLILRKLHDTTFRLYAAPAYLQRVGAPERLDALATHACVLFRSQRGRCVWVLDGPTGRAQVTVHGQIRGDDLAFVRRSAIAGLGVALLPDIPGALAVRAGLLAPVLPAYCMRSSPLFLVYPSVRHLPPRVRLLRDFLIERFPSIDELDIT